MTEQERHEIIRALEAIASALTFCETNMELVMRDRIDAIYEVIDKLGKERTEPNGFCAWGEQTRKAD